MCPERFFYDPKMNVRESGKKLDKTGKNEYSKRAGAPDCIETGPCLIRSFNYGPFAQLGARFTRLHTRYNFIFLLQGPIAQLGERKVRNLEVRGSIPLGSTKEKDSRRAVFFFGDSGRGENP